MRLTALLLSALLPQDDAKDLWDFKPGTQWTYEEKEGEQKKKSVMTAKEKKDGKLILESKEYEEGAQEPTKTEALYSHAKDGFVIWGQIQDGKESEFLRVLKIGSKKGDKWKSPMGGAEVEVEVEHAGEEKITVAGKEHTAIRCTFKIGDDPAASGSATYHLVRGMGLVRFHMKLGELGTFALDLKEFKAGK